MISIIRHKLFTLRAKLWACLFIIHWRLTLVINKNKNEQKKQLKNILHINTDNLSGGAPKIARNLTIYQLKKDYNSSMLVKNQNFTDEFCESIPLNISKKQHFLAFAQKSLQWQDFFHLNSFEIIKNKRFKKADIVHVHNLHGDFFSYLALPQLTNIKHTVWSLHDMHPITGHCSHSFDCEKWKTGCGYCPNLTIYPQLTKDTTSFIHNTKKIAYANSKLHIVALSKWLKDKLAHSILKNHPIHLIYNGVDTSIFKPKDASILKKKLGIVSSKIVVLFSANLGTSNPFKGGSYLIEMVNEYQHNDNILFIALGNSDKTEYTQPNLLSIPYIHSEEEMALYYSLADIYLYPTLADNCPLVALEAMGCGTPVLAFNTGGTPELVLHKKTGYIANYKDIKDLITGLEWLLFDSIRLKDIGENGVKRVQKHFTLERMNEEYLKLYQQILN